MTIHAEFQSRIADPIGMEDFESGDVFYHFEPVSMHPCYKFRMTALDMARFVPFIELNPLRYLPNPSDSSYSGTRRL